MEDAEDRLPKPSALRIVCECGGELGVLTLPNDNEAFTATCPGCGTRYRRQMNKLALRGRPGERVTVVLPRSRPRD